MQDVLRHQWGFKGHIVSNCDAIADIHDGHKLVSSKTGAAALALRRGVNLNCGDLSLYPFGFGLSYTSFVYSDLQLSASKVKKNANASVNVTLTNNGKLPSDEVAALCYFQRVSLAPGASTRLSFTLTPEQLSLIDGKGQPFQEAGKIRISVAGSLPTHRSEELGAAKAVETELEITAK